MVTEVSKYNEFCGIIDEYCCDAEAIFLKDLFSKGKILECEEDATDEFNEKYLKVRITFRAIVDFELMDGKLSFGDWMRNFNKGTLFTWYFEIFLDGSYIVDIYDDESRGYVGGLQW